MPEVLLVDVNNVRGQVNFVCLPDFCSAVWRWAQAAGRPELVILAVDHGSKPAAFSLGPGFVVVFSGCKGDADTVLVHTVDFMLTQLRERRAVTVVTHDRLLLRRTQFGLPPAPEDSEWYLSRGLSPPGNPEFDTRGGRRPASERERLRVRSSDAFAAELRRAAALQRGPCGDPLEEEEEEGEEGAGGIAGAVASLARLALAWIRLLLLPLLALPPLLAAPLRALLSGLPLPSWTSADADLDAPEGMFGVVSPRWLVPSQGSRRHRRPPPGKKKVGARRRTKRRENSADRAVAAEAMRQHLEETSARRAGREGAEAPSGEGAEQRGVERTADRAVDRAAEFVRWFLDESELRPLIGYA